MCVFVKQQSDGCITSPVSNQLEAYKGESLFLPFRTVIGGPVLGFLFHQASFQIFEVFVDTILPLETRDVERFKAYKFQSLQR